MTFLAVRRSTRTRAVGGLLALLLPAGVAVGAILPAAGATTPATLDLGSAAAASVLAGTAVSSTGDTVLHGDLDSSPGTVAAGFPPGTVDGTEHLDDEVAAQAQSDLSSAYDAAVADDAPAGNDETGVDLSGETLSPGVYDSTGGLNLTGTTPLTLDGDASSVWILQAGSTLLTAADTSVRLTGGAQACNVFWQVGSSATLGANSTFVGNILASASITIGADSSLDGRALARSGAVTLADNRITTPECATTIPSLTLGSSAAAATFGTSVALTADISPTDATGTVSFVDLLSTGPQAGQTVPVGTAELAGGVASAALSLPAFGSNTITADYGGDATHAAVTSATIDVAVDAYTGEVIIDQLRASGPAGAGDQYVELYNTGAAVPLAGLVVSAGSGRAVTIPDTAPTLPTGHSYLIGGDEYSLSGVAPSDLTATTDAAAGLQVSAPDVAGTVLDAVGFVGDATGFFTGTGLPALTGTPTQQYAWVRREIAGAPVETGDNAADFDLVSTTGGSIGGRQSMLGSPAPLASGSPVQDNADLESALLDPTVASSVGANRTYIPGVPGTLTVRRTITNTGAATVTSAEVRITALSETDGDSEPGVVTPPAHPAALRLIDPVTSSSPVLVGVDTVTVENLSVDSPADAGAGAGIDTTLSIPLGPGLAPGRSINVAFTFAVDHGGRYWFGYDVDALTGSTSADGRRRSSPGLPATAPEVDWANVGRSGGPVGFVEPQAHGHSRSDLAGAAGTIGQGRSPGSRPRRMRSVTTR